MVLAKFADTLLRHFLFKDVALTWVDTFKVKGIAAGVRAKR